MDPEGGDDDLWQSQVAIPERRFIEALAVEALVVGRGDLDVLAVAQRGEDVEVLVDGGAQRRASVFAVVNLEVGASAGQTDAQRCAGD